MKEKCKNKTFYHALKNYTIKVLEILCQSDIVNGCYVYNSWVKQEDCYIKKNIERSTFSNIISENRDRLLQLQEYKNCLATMSQSQVLKKYKGLVGTYGGGSRFAEEDIINIILIKMTNEKGIFEYNDDFFNSEYLELESFLFSTSIKAELITPLIGFKSASKQIKLDKDVSIIKLSENQSIELLNNGIKLADRFDEKIFCGDICEHAILVNYVYPKLFDDEFRGIKGKGQELRKPYYKKNQKVIYLLRLFKSSNIFPLETIEILRFYRGNYFRRSRTKVPSFFNNNNQYAEIDSTDTKAIQKIWKQINTAEFGSKKFLNTALRRFNQAKDRELLEDKIIDFLICAEALFLIDSTTELSYRLAHRAAIFLENEASKREEIFSFFKDIYNVRSKIIHGDEITTTKLPKKLPKKSIDDRYSLEETCEKIEEHLRKALLKFIEIANQKGSSKELVNWEKLILGI